jgi:tetratricopeptide (TPR) repeat protein
LEQNRKELDRWIARARSEGLQPLSRAHNLAIALLYQGRGKDALRVLRDASQPSRQSGRDKAACHRLAAQILLEIGKPEEALEQARLAIQDGAGDIDEWEGLFLFSIAHARCGRWEESEKAAEALRSKSTQLLGDRSRRRNHQLVGELALLRGETALAIDELGKAEALLPPKGIFWGLVRMPDHVPIWFALASAYLASGSEEKARQYLERIVNTAGERLAWPILFVRSLCLLSKIHEANGNDVLARQYLGRALELWRGGDMDPTS